MPRSAEPLACDAANHDDRTITTAAGSSLDAFGHVVAERMTESLGSVHHHGKHKQSRADTAAANQLRADRISVAVNTRR